MHAEAHAAGADVETSVAEWRVFADIDDSACVVGVVHHGYEDDSGTDFERAWYVVALAVGQADQREDTSGFGG